MNFKWTGGLNNSRHPVRNLTFSIIPLLMITISCSLFPTKPGSTDIRFNMNFKYADKRNTSVPLRFLNQNKDGIFQLSKPDVPLMIDVVCVLVLDFSKYNDLEEFFASEEYHEFIHVSSEWTGDLQYWAEWEKLFGQVLSIASNQTIPIEGDSARGNVPGVVGMNYFIVAMLEVKIWQSGKKERRKPSISKCINGLSTITTIITNRQSPTSISHPTRRPSIMANYRHSAVLSIIQTEHLN
jgi:hypothetical protein